MTSHAKHGKETGASSPVKPFGVSTDGPRVDDKKQQMSQKSSSQKIDDQDAPQSRHLWVGNVSSGVTEPMLAEQFARFGDLENVSVYPTRNYAFVNFRNEEDAIYARKGLQGLVLGGLALRIEYAKGAKPCKHLWIGCICSSITKEQLEEELKSFGVVEDLRFMRDHNSAFVEFLKIDDAIAAYDSLSRRKLGNEELQVEYAKPQRQPKWDASYESQHQVDERIIAWDSQGISGIKGLHTNGMKGTTIAEKFKEDRDGEPSEVLWVGHPIYMKVDERSLRKAFSPFGEIERITTFPGRTYAFVQFQSIKAASRAKDALHGKLFNDPRVSISFAKSEVGPVDYNRGANSYSSPSQVKGHLTHLGGLFRSGVNPRNDRYLGLYSTSPNNPGLNPSYGQSLDGVDAHETSIHVQGRVYGSDLNLSMGGEFNRVSRLASEHGLPSEVELWNNAIPERAALQHNGLGPEESWDNRKEDVLKRELKRQKIGKEPLDECLAEVTTHEFTTDKQPFEVLLPHSRLGGLRDDVEASLAVRPSRDGHWQDQDGFKQGFQELDTVTVASTDFSRTYKDDWPLPEGYLGIPKDGWKWQGTIAKSGTPVCQARCSSVGKPLDITLPDVVNCTARTNLDLLAKHISQAGEFGVVFFVPYSELDIAPYQEFMFYLTDKKRAAVCKLSDEATLFLVPPADFVEQFLKVPRSTYVFGVVLNLHQLHNQTPKVSGEHFLAPQQFMQIQRSFSSTRHTEESQHTSIAHGPTEHPFPDVGAMPNDANQFTAAQPPDIPLPQELFASMSSLLPQKPQSNSVAATIPFQTVSSMSVSSRSTVIPSAGVMAGNSLTKGPAGPVNHLNHISVEEARIAYQPQGWSPMQQEHHNSLSVVSNFNFTPGDLYPPKLEQGSAMQSQGFSPLLPGSHAHGLLGAAHYQQPRPPPFLPSSLQLPPCNQLSQMTALLTHQQQQPPHDPTLLLQQSVQQQAPLNVQQHSTSQLTQLPNFPLSSESLPVQGSQLPFPQPTPPPPPPPLSPMLPAFSQGGSWGRVGETSESQVLQAEQQQMSSENQANGGSVEDQKRFQATLQLAAALLEQLQQRKS